MVILTDNTIFVSSGLCTSLLDLFSTTKIKTKDFDPTEIFYFDSCILHHYLGLICESH